MVEKNQSHPGETAKAFSQTITTHGVSYVGDKSSWSLVERVFWAFAVASSIIYCLLMLVDSLGNWSENKYVIQLESYGHPAQVRQLKYE